MKPDNSTTSTDSAASLLIKPAFFIVTMFTIIALLSLI